MTPMREEIRKLKEDLKKLTPLNRVDTLQKTNRK